MYLVRLRQGGRKLSSNATSLDQRDELEDSQGSDASARLPIIWTMFSDDGLPQRLLHLAKMIERATSRQMQDEFEMSIAQWRVLAFICLSGPATASFIGEAAEADQAEISRAVKALTQSGYVTREYEPGSRKTMIIAPTPLGRKRFEKILAARRRYFASVTGRLERGERRLFLDMLTTMAEDVVNERTRVQTTG